MIIIIIFISLIIYFVYRTAIESFDNVEIYTTRLYGAAKHIRLDKFHRVESLHLDPPLPKVGESRCYTVQCPQYVPEFSTCYNCT
jgi:hypothetical protein